MSARTAKGATRDSPASPRPRARERQVTSSSPAAPARRSTSSGKQAFAENAVRPRPHRRLPVWHPRSPDYPPCVQPPIALCGAVRIATGVATSNARTPHSSYPRTVASSPQPLTATSPLRGFLCCARENRCEIFCSVSMVSLTRCHAARAEERGRHDDGRHGWRWTDRDGAEDHPAESRG